MLDLTTLEKTGAFLDPEIHVLKDKIGLHLMRFLLLALLAFVLAYWTALESTPSLTELDWGRAARLARDNLVPQVIARDALRELRRVKPILESQEVMCYTDFI